MTPLYLVEWGFYSSQDSPQFGGVFSSQEKAKGAIMRLQYEDMYEKTPTVLTDDDIYYRIITITLDPKELF